MAERGHTYTEIRSKLGISEASLCLRAQKEQWDIARRNVPRPDPRTITRRAVRRAIPRAVASIERYLENDPEFIRRILADHIDGAGKFMREAVRRVENQDARRPDDVRSLTGAFCQAADTQRKALGLDRANQPGQINNVLVLGRVSAGMMGDVDHRSEAIQVSTSESDSTPKFAQSEPGPDAPVDLQQVTEAVSDEQ